MPSLSTSLTRILVELARASTPLRCADLCERLGLKSKGTIADHMARLRQMGLVVAHPGGYSLADDVAVTLSGRVGKVRAL